MAATLPGGHFMLSIWLANRGSAMKSLKNLIVATLLIGSLLLGVLVATATACTGHCGELRPARSVTLERTIESSKR